MIFQKPLEFWIAILVGMGVVIDRNKEKTPITRMLLSGISGGIGFSLTPSVATWTGRDQVIVAMVLTAFGHLVMDVLSSILADRKFLMGIIKQRIGGSE